MKNIVAISGYSGSGKSTLIQQLSKKYKFDIIKFGEVHRESTKNSGYRYAKDWIKEKGFSEYEKKLLICFRNKMISTVNSGENNIIIDGIFSDKCFEYLKSINGIQLNNIVLDTSYSIRIKRMMEREQLSFEDAIRHLTVTDSIKLKAGLANIIRDYDCIINANISKEQIMKECISILENLGIYPDIQSLEKEI